MSVTAAQGFEASGVSAGIRPSGHPDVAVVRSVPAAVGAALWTTNRVQAAPVTVSRRHLSLAEPQAVLINAGVANAATGKQGEEDAVASAVGLADALGLEPEQVLVLSTGVIGVRLPLDKVLAGAQAAVGELSAAGGDAAAGAILTTDSGPKMSVRHSGGFTVGGMAKGAGMIHPRLATMLVVITTDYPLTAGEAEEFLRPAVERSFNRISVDGECSTNDAVILLSSGAAAIQRTPATDEAFVLALRNVCSDLSHQIVVDGEGATLVAEINVTGAVNVAEARAIAQRIATSPLVKTALFGHDANWGRVLMAAGSAPFNGGYAHVDATLVSLSYNGTAVLVGGAPQNAEPKVDGAVCTIDLDLGLGDGRAAYLTSDLSYDYVRINAEYRS
jgi:glutamate N-acetyltransferase / amino-acid N-acetyltransferase